MHHEVLDVLDGDSLLSSANPNHPFWVAIQAPHADLSSMESIRLG